MLVTMGLDWKWWLMPTRPIVNVNYYEKLYTLKQIKMLREFEEDEWDEDRKILWNEKRRTELEKKVLGVGIMITIGLWAVWGRYAM